MIFFFEILTWVSLNAVSSFFSSRREGWLEEGSPNPFQPEESVDYSQCDSYIFAERVHIPLVFCQRVFQFVVCVPKDAALQ